MNGHVGCLIQMPNNCCVFGCNSNYATTKERVSVFSFPKDEILKLQWIRKIPNQNLNVTKYSFICETHFTQNEISRYHIIGDKQVSTI